MAKKARADGRYQTKIYLGHGKYKYIYASTQKELKKAVSEARVLLGKGVDIAPERDTFGDWAQMYKLQRQVDFKRNNLTKSRLNITYSRLDDLSELNNMPVSKIRTQDIQMIIDKKAIEGTSASVLKDIKSAAKHTLQLAVDNRIILYNPADAVKIENDKHKEHKRRALTIEEQHWIESPTNNRGQIAAMIMLHAGLRRGELIPLQWNDIDLINGTIRVNKAVEIDNNKARLKNYGKTDASTRTVYIPKILINFLTEKNKSATSFLVCPSAKGSMLSETGYRRMWESYISELNFKFGNFNGLLVDGKAFSKPKSRFAPVKIPMVIPPITAHWLRHTFITNMYLAGIDVLTAKEQAGHADIKTTLDIYTHLDSIHKKRQINKLDDYLESSEHKNKIKKA